MQLRRLLARIDGSTEDLDTLNAAWQLARHFSAHIDALNVKPDPNDIPMITGLRQADDLALLVNSLTASSEGARQRARRNFNLWQKQVDIPLTLHRTEPPKPSAMLLEREERETLTIIHEGRLSDMIIIAQPTEQNGYCSLPALEAAMFETRRPVLMIPSGCPVERYFLNPVIAWNGSAEAALAVSGALPLLRRIGSEAAIFTAKERKHDARAADLAAYLRWHEIAAEPLSADTAEGTIASRLLDTAEKRNSGLLIMGAYTHGRLHEIILGGVTRHMVHHARLPVLFSH